LNFAFKSNIAENKPETFCGRAGPVRSCSWWTASSPVG